MKVLFLDIDGVLNSEADFRKVGTSYCLNEDMCNLLADWLEKNDVFVVLSSTWRNHENHVEFLKETAPRITNRFHKDWRTYNEGLTISRRGDEVQGWLDGHQGNKQYFIIDDLELGWHPAHRYRLVKTQDGLTKYHIEKLNGLLY